MVFGKVIGGLLGLASGSTFGLIIGVLIGHAFDRGLVKALQFGSPKNIERIKNSFFETTFLLGGYLAKVDGRISQTEIDHTEQLIAAMGLSADQRRRAIAFFHSGAGAAFKPEATIAAFLEACGRHPQLQKTLLVFLISLAHADQEIAPVEHSALVRIAGLLGMSEATLEQLLRMVAAQNSFQGQGGFGAQAGGGTNLSNAYTALGVDRSVSDKELKHAYRKLMSENHPDKLIAQGLPENMIKLATERSQEIQAAYAAVRKDRGTGK